MRIHLLRHATSRQQVEGGEDWDSPLSPGGQAQCRALEGWLVGQRAPGGLLAEASCLRSSPLLRARQTAHHVSRALGLEITLAPWLREARFHVSDELPEPVGPLDPTTKGPAGAPYLDLEQEARRALEQLVHAAERTRGDVVAVSHGGLLKTLLRIVLGNPQVTFRLHNTGLSCLEWTGRRWSLAALDRLDHLASTR